jgi:hypothetical protein
MSSVDLVQILKAVDPCEHRSESSGCIRGQVFLDWLVV